MQRDYSLGEDEEEMRFTIKPDKVGVLKYRIQENNQIHTEKLRLISLFTITAVKRSIPDTSFHSCFCNLQALPWAPRAVDTDVLCSLQRQLFSSSV